MADDLIVPNPPASYPAQLARQAAADGALTPLPQTPPELDYKLNPAKAGEDYDDCPNPSCGTRDVDPLYRIKDSRTFQCSCCGTAWNREGREAHEHNEAVGLGRFSAQRRTQAAATERVVSAPSRLYLQNYDRAFGKGKYAQPVQAAEVSQS